MLSTLAERRFRAIYGSVFLTGCSLSACFSVLSLYLRGKDLPTDTIGAIATAVAAGGVLAAVPLGPILKRSSAKHTLALALIGYAAAVGALPFFADPIALGALRLGEGACTVGVWVAYETLFLARARPAERATVSSLYGIVLALGYVAGPVMARGTLALGWASAPFFAAAGLAALNALLVGGFIGAEERTLPPAGSISPPDGTTAALSADENAPSRSSDAPLFWRIKMTCFGMLAAGYLRASLVVYLPLFLVEHRHVDAGEPPTVLACYATGTLLFAGVAARLSDRYGHLLTMRVLAALGATAMLAFLFASAVPLMYVVGACVGAMLGAITPIGMALQGGIAARAEYGRATAISNGCYAAGTLIGPPLSGIVYRTSPSGSIAHIALLFVAFAVVASIFAKDDPARRSR